MFPKLAMFSVACFVVLASVPMPTLAVPSKNSILPKLILTIQGVGYAQTSEGSVFPVSLYLVYKEENWIGIPENKYFKLALGFVRVDASPPIALKEGYAMLNLQDKKIKLFAEVKNVDLGGVAISLFGTFTTSRDVLKMKLDGTLRSWTILYPLHIWATSTLQPVKP